MARHKHADVIHAWAEGEKIQYRLDDDDVWHDVKDPAWSERNQYRVKPKTVKREGWVNIYPSNAYTAYIGYAFKTQEEADSNENDGRAACIRIEWEEEA